ncbi:hypothetical protein IOC57_18825 [Bacillus sp. SD075]|uniref:hypothetical protein n=1 Tax=Bacillus sp. SD075 TaxID=2781732 RepID=UPI001A95C45B|nr:hypothetical protein [Bacillus sp. SD075]MBO0999787.1 hypothetical protein [Bacillus sp. SD075]
MKEGGIRTLGITVEIQKVCRKIERVKEDSGDDIIADDVTVLNPETVRAVMMAEAEFIFSPTVNVNKIKMVKRYSVSSIPFAYTPTDIMTASSHPSYANWRCQPCFFLRKGPTRRDLAVH